MTQATPCVGNTSCRRVQARRCRENGNFVDEYRSLFKATSIIMQTIPKHASFKGQRWQKLHTELSKTLSNDVLRLEELKALLRSGQVTAPRTIKPGAVRVEPSRMPTIDWTLHTPTAAGRTQLPDHFFVSNPTVERMASAQAAPADPNDPFAASAAFSTLSLAPSSPIPPPQHAGAAALPDWVHSLPQRTGTQAVTAKHSLYGSVPSDAPPPSHLATRVDHRPQYPAIEAPQAPCLDLIGAPPQNIPAPPLEVEVKTQVVTSIPTPDPHSGCSHPHIEPPCPPGNAPQSSDDMLQRLAATDELKNVYVHPGFMREFLAYAQSNTRRGIESCGILGGELTADSSAFTITKLIIPKQAGERDKVEMTDDVGLHGYMAERGLMPLGWIHTHPTQTCFLSSIDVHTQCGYQAQLPEAMAIVMAPTDPRLKQEIFRLTTPGGLRLIQGCNEKGFHPHPTPDNGQEVYEVCGHVYYDETATFKCDDLR